MSTPQTLSQPLPSAGIHQHLDHHQRYLPSPHDRYLPPPRPSSNITFHKDILTRPPINAQSYQFAPAPPRPQAGLSNGYEHPHSQSRGGAEYACTNGITHQAPHEDLRRPTSGAGQRQKPAALPPLQSQQPHAPPIAPSLQLPGQYIKQEDTMAGAEGDTTRRGKSDVDWRKFYGDKPPSEVIVIHDDDSPVPPEQNQRPPPPVTQGSYSRARHIDKRRRVNGGHGEVPTYSNSNTPYSHANATSAESYQAATTAPTSLGSVASNASIAGPATGKLDGAQSGQKRKRTTRISDAANKKLEAERTGPRGYLAEYGEYIPPVRQHKKQRDVHVPVLPDRHKTHGKIDDEDGHYIVHENSRLGDKYQLLNLLGQGTFGKVVRATDIRSRKEVAVKIIRAVPKFRDASRIELRVLQTLRAADEQNRNRCIQLRDCFDWRGHVCLVTPLLGLSVFDFLKQGSFVPFPGSHIQAFARQLLGSIAFLHDLKLIHTDLKPENILLISHAYQTFTYNRNIPSSTMLTARSAKFRRVLLSPHINLIDFGSATFDDEYHSPVVSTRHYRAPEIILGIGWSYPIDLWSLGCILVECWTGDALFQTHDCCEHLGMMEAVIGQPIDKSLIREVNRLSKRGDRESAARFFKNGHLAYPLPDTPRQSRKLLRGMKRLEETIPPNNQFNKLFLDLLRRIFVYDPKKRITAREALKHPWFHELAEDDGTEAGRIRVERERQASLTEQEREAERALARGAGYR